MAATFLGAGEQTLERVASTSASTWAASSPGTSVCTSHVRRREVRKTRRAARFSSALGAEQRNQQARAP